VNAELSPHALAAEDQATEAAVVATTHGNAEDVAKRLLAAVALWGIIVKLPRDSVFLHFSHIKPFVPKKGHTSDHQRAGEQLWGITPLASKLC